jgi:hypothetical protein
VFSRKPSFSNSLNDDYVKFDYGRYNDKVIQGGDRVAVLVDERVAGRLSFYQQNTDGRFDNQFTGKKDGGLQDGAIRGQLLAALTPNLEATLNLHYRNYEVDGGIVSGASCPRRRGLPRRLRAKPATRTTSAPTPRTVTSADQSGGSRKTSSGNSAAST